MYGEKREKLFYRFDNHLNNTILNHLYILSLYHTYRN